MRALLAALMLLCLPASALAGLTKHDLGAVSLAPAPNATVPLDLVFRDSEGHRATLRDIIGARPALILFADYTCRTVCKPALAIASGALAETGLPPEDYRLLVVGLDAKDSTADAKDMLQQVGDPGVARATVALMNDGDNVARMAAAAGYRFAYDAANDQFAHPAGLIAVTSTGRISRVLSSLAVNVQDLRLALVEAGNGQIGRIQDRLTLLCYGFDAVHGVYAPAIGLLLKAAAGVTVLALLLGILMMWRHDRRSRRMSP